MGLRIRLWQFGIMLAESDNLLTLRVVNGLYIEAMVLADEARAYFDQASHDARDRMPPLVRVTFSCESLKVTTRLMHVVAWLLGKRAMTGNETIRAKSMDLGSAAESDPDTVNALPEEARRIILATSELYQRVHRLDIGMRASPLSVGPARQLQARLMAGL